MDIISRLQRLPVGRFHYRLLAIVGLGWMFDAMDTGMIAFIMPSLVKAWQLSPSQSGFIVSLTFVGMALGAVVAGRLADQFGRRTVLACTLAIYSTATALCAFAPNLTYLLILRFLVGIGLGGQLPVAVSLVSEYIPSQVRGRFIVLLESFWGLGWLCAALISYWIIPKIGWHAAFLIGGLPLFYVWIILTKIPESVPYLVNKGKIQQAHQIVQDLEKQSQITVIDIAEVKPVTIQKVSFKQLWQRLFYKRTLMLWLIWFGIVFSYYGIFTWLPSLLVKQGFDIVKSFEYVLFMILAQLPGYVVAAWCVEKWGRKTTLASFILLCAVSTYFFGQSASNTSLIVWGCLMSFFNLGAWGVLYTYTPEQYPTLMRAFGAGWASAIGRVGGITAPLIVTQLMVLDGAFHRVFFMFTAVLVAVALVVIVLGEETKGKILD
ncbi:MFS transporter [Acinetobacter sp. HY1485]|uniref:MFS transporter n=1 Tax=Acinetobacter sp. HY1485 TaxID=2970918 RepID=UPI0022B961D4|nr:MFS transporter [Acinetobacter sp. HY1485]